MADEESGPMFLAACKRANMSLLNQILTENVDNKDFTGNFKDGLGNTALHYAAMGNHTEIATLLFEQLKGRIDPSISNYAGDTAVHKAVEKNHLDFLKLLVENGAKTESLNKKGRTPASLALSQAARDILKQAQVASSMTTKSAPTNENTNKNEVAPEKKIEGPVNTAAYIPAQFDPDMIASDDE